MFKMLNGLPDNVIRKVMHENASKLYRLPLPEKCLP